MKTIVLIVLITILTIFKGLSQSLEFSQSVEHSFGNEYRDGSNYQSNLDSLADVLDKEKFADKTVIKYFTINRIAMTRKDEFIRFMETKYENDDAIASYILKNEKIITLQYLQNLTDSLVRVNINSFSALSASAQNNHTSQIVQPNPPIALRAALAPTPCNNLDFAAGTAGWNGFYGGRKFCRTIRLPFGIRICWWPLRNWKNNPGIAGWGNPGISPINTPANTTGPRSGSQFCINTPGFSDPYVPSLSTTPPNGANSLRLGSSQVQDRSAQKAENTFFVTPANNKLIYHYAVVIQDPGAGHSVAQQPYFRIRVRDQGGNEIVCYSFDVTGRSATWIGGFQTLAAINAPSGPPEPGDDEDPIPAEAPLGGLVREWTSVLVPLDDYEGQNVTLSFETNDCTQGAHFAYAYVSAECGNANLILTQPNVCRGNPGKIIAPGGAFGYSWTGPGIIAGATNDTVTIDRPGRYVCTISLFSNNPALCTYDLDTLVTIDPRAPKPNFISNNTVCSNTPISFINTSSLITERPNSDWDFQNDGIVDFVGETPPPYTFINPGTYLVNLTVRGGFCIHDTTMEITVNATPVTFFNANNVCQNLATNFVNLSNIATRNITLWEWSFTNNGTIDDNAKNPNYIYPNSGTFVASLKATSDLGCSFTYTTNVDVWGRAIPDFSANKVCYNQATDLINLTSFANPNLGNISGCSWVMGDGTPNQNLVDISHVYLLNGNINTTYDVMLTVATSHGCSDNITKTINVYAKPDASFTSNFVCFGLPSQLISTSVGNGNTINNYRWDVLSNGTIDYAGISNINAVLPGYGYNPVTLEVITNPVAGLTCSSKAMADVWVNPNPIVNFTYSNKCINAQPVGFDALNTTIAIGTNTNYAWSFGDGLTDASQLPVTSHDYANVGRYNVRLTVTSDSGCVKSALKTVDIYQKPFTNFVSSSACAKKEMSFGANPVGNSGNITNWFWDFDNDVTTLESTGQDVMYAFPTSGNNTVALITETENGCMDTLYQVVYVDYLPRPRFSANNISGCAAPLCVTFTNNTLPVTAPAVNQTWQWVFGDGSSITVNTGDNQTHCFSKSNSSKGTSFDVKLIVTTDKGCTDSIEKSSFVKVYPKPVADFSANPTDASVVMPLVTFTNESEGYTKWWWNFGDSNPVVLDSTSVSPNYFYNNTSADFYNSNLIVANQYGCVDTAYLKITIGPDFAFYVPNAFSPKVKDGVNDMFTGKGIGIIDYEMRIFDRWGAEIFTTNKIDMGWMGTLKNGLSAKSDVYTWKVHLTDVFNKEHDYVGHVTLLK